MCESLDRAEAGCEATLLPEPSASIVFKEEFSPHEDVDAIEREIRQLGLPDDPTQLVTEFSLTDDCVLSELSTTVKEDASIVVAAATVRKLNLQKALVYKK